MVAADQVGRATTPPGAVPVWYPAAGVVLALVALGGWRTVWVTILAALVIGLLPGGTGLLNLPLLIALAAAAHLLVALVNRGILRLDLALGTMRDAVALGLLCVIGPAIFRLLSLAVTGCLFHPGAACVQPQFERWLADLTGAATVTPFLLAFPGLLPGLGSPRPLPTTPGAWRRGVAGVALAVALAIGIIAVDASLPSHAISVLLFVPVAWMAISLDLRGATIGLLLTTLFFAAAERTAGPLLGSELSDRIFLVALSGAGLILGLLAEHRNRVERQLRLSKARYRLIADHSGDVVVLLDQARMCRYVSPSIEALFGWRPEEIADQPLAGILHPDDAQRLPSLLAPQSGEPVLIRVRGADDEYRWVEWTVRPFADPARPAEQLLVVTGRDVTDRQRLEETLRQSQKLESVGRLAGGIAHDFNNLLTAVLGHADLLESEPGVSGPITEHVTEIRRASERAAQLTRQLLAFARRQPAEPRAVSSGPTLVGVEGLLGRLLGEDVRFTTRLAGDLWAVRVDPVQLEQVLVNLAVNARDAMPDGGQLVIAAENATVTRGRSAPPGLEPGEYVEIRVRDTGQGMAPEVLDRAFEPFFTTKEVGKGTGLGLAVCHGIVRQAGGQILAESEVGVGTAVRVFLPRAGFAAEPEPAIPDRLAAPGTGETILLVEDEAQVRRLASRVLRGRGYRVLEAANGQQALELAEAHTGVIALLVSDVVMPGLSGPVLAERLEQRRGVLPVLFVSGFSDSGPAVANGRTGPAGFLPKPYSPDVLAGRVREMLDQSCAGRPAERAVT